MYNSQDRNALGVSEDHSRQIIPLASLFEGITSDLWPACSRRQLGGEGSLRKSLSTKFSLSPKCVMSLISTLSTKLNKLAKLLVTC